MSNSIPPQSPAGPRSASTGPNGPLPTPTSTAAVNGVGNTAGTTPAPAAAPSQPLSQQNLNQIVIDYLNKKGYTRAEAVLRAESSNQAIPPELEFRKPDNGPPKYLEAYTALQKWVTEALETYKPEIQRLMWPFFVYSFIGLVDGSHSRSARDFWLKFNEQFRSTHEADLRRLEHILTPEAQQEDNLAKIFKDNKYRLPMTQAAFQYLMQFLESLPASQYRGFIGIIENHLDIRQVSRAVDDQYSFESILRRGQEDQVVEDEGIPGHKPGNAISSTDPTVGTTLAGLKLGKLAMEKELEEDVRGDLADLDTEMPNIDGPSLVETHEKVNIKQEDEEDGPSRTDIPYPPSTARDVAMEVQKIRENRDRLKVEGRTNGIGPGLSCVIFTFHNTKDHITTMAVSGDSTLVAAGTDMSYIRLWSLEGNAIGTDDTGAPVNSKRLIGHSGPIYSLSFAPSTTQPPNQTADTSPQWLLSSSGDATVRLWNLTTFQPIVVYKGHVGPVWSVSFSPLGTYFATGGADKTARLWITNKVSPRRFFVGHDEDVDVVAWHPNTAYIFTSSSDKTVRMWSVSNGQPVRMFTGHNAPITSLSCARNGKYLASGDEQGNILLWDLTPGKLYKQLKGHGKGGVWSLSWSVESTVLVSGGADQTVRVWDVNLPARDTSVTKTADGTKDAITGAVGSAAAGVQAAATTAVGQPTKKKGKGPNVSADQISAFLTKKTPVKFVGLTNMNLIVAAGSYLPENFV